MVSIFYWVFLFVCLFLFSIFTQPSLHTRFIPLADYNTLTEVSVGALFPNRKRLKRAAGLKEQHRELLKTEMELGLVNRGNLNPLHTKLTSNVISIQMPEEIAILLRGKKSILDIKQILTC